MLMERSEATQAKYNDIYENNILISKDKSKVAAHKCEDQVQQQSEFKMMNNI